MKKFIFTNNPNVTEFNEEVVICNANNIVSKVALSLKRDDIVIVNKASDFNTVEDFKQIIRQVTAEYPATFICINTPALNIIDGNVNEKLIRLIEDMSSKEKVISKSITNSYESQIVSYTLLEAIGEVAQFVV